jgi:hypothetical protein
MVYFMELVRHIILECVEQPTCSSKYLRGMPTYVTNTQKLSESLPKIPQTVGQKELRLFASSPTACVQTHGIVKKSVGQQITNKKQPDQRMSEVGISCISIKCLYSSIEVPSGKRSKFETLNPSLLCNESNGFLKRMFKPNTDFTQFPFSEHLAFLFSSFLFYCNDPV